jgi:uncharacterized Ntn-hydrolase superfamily protein
MGAARSAGLAVVEEGSGPVADLRVDDRHDPAAELTRLWGLWRGQKAAYVRRVREPGGDPGVRRTGRPALIPECSGLEKRWNPGR